jgi:uncharacterized MAPEG superfamily protein
MVHGFLLGPPRPHAIVYLLGIAYVRTVAFLIGFVALVGVFWEVVT